MNDATIPPLNDASATRLPRSALALVAGQGISGLGSALTGFGLNVWVFRQTGSFGLFALLTVIANLPQVAFAPIAGAIADRIDKRRLLIGCDIAAMAIVLALLYAHSHGTLTVPLVAVSNLLLSACSVQRWSAIGPAISLLVPKGLLGRINGLMQSFNGIRVMLGPMLGALALGALGLDSLFAFDALSYVPGLAILLLIGIPSSPAARSPGDARPRRRDELTYGLRWIAAHAPFRRMLVFFALINIAISVYTVTFAPYVMSFASNRTLGTGMCMEGGGAVVMGLVLARLRLSGGEEARIIWGAFGVGAVMMAWGMLRAPAAIFGAALLLGALFSIITSSSQTLWQANVPIEHQGKVFAVRMAVAFGLTPLSVLGAVPLAQFVTAPALDRLPWAAHLWGTAQAGPLGLMLSFLGLGVLLCAVMLRARGGLGFAPCSTPAEPTRAAGAPAPATGH